MTVKYASKLATNSSIGSFSKLLFRWRGSVYKILWMEYALYITLYFIVSLIYRFALDMEQQMLFEKVANFFERSRGSISMTFMLGFFVTSVISKWWQIYNNIPSPEHIALFLNCNIRAKDEETKLLKKTVMRQSILSLCLTFLKLSPSFKRQYPTLDQLISEGLLTEKEKGRLERMEKKTSQCGNHWLPISWAADLLMEADKEEGKVINCQKLIDELNKFRHGCTLLLEYEHSAVPLAYIQVVTIAVYSYFFSCLFGRQWLIRDSRLMDLDLYFPILTTLEFIFYVGWLNVAESLVNPFGCDDDDLDLNEIMQRYRQVTYTMANATDDEKDFDSLEDDSEANLIRDDKSPDFGQISLKLKASEV